MKAKKSYGQHFLHDENICQKIAQSILDLDDYDILVEVGPGRGAITKYLVKTDRPFFVIEADRDMVAFLKANLPELPQAMIIEQDFLKVNLEEQFAGQQIAVVGNFPYNISSQIVVKVIQYRSVVKHMVGMFQKEMADRILSGSGNKEYGSLSVQTEAFFDKYSVINVGAGAFSPPPKVQSKVIGMERKIEAAPVKNEKFFRLVVRSAFGMRRKMLRNSLKGIPGGLDHIPEQYLTKRPEQLEMMDFVTIANAIQE